MEDALTQMKKSAQKGPEITECRSDQELVFHREGNLTKDVLPPQPSNVDDSVARASIGPR